MPRPPKYIYYLNSSKNILLLKFIINFVLINSVIFFLNQKSKSPSDGTLLWRTSGEVFVFLFIFDVHLHLSMSFILLLYLHLTSRLLYHVTGTPPWFLRPVKASTSSELYPDYFWLPFLFHLPRALRFWVGIFYPQAFFTLRSFPTFLAQPAFIKASLGAGSYSLKFLGIHTDPRNAEPAHLFVWITAIHNLVFIYVNIAKVLLVVKSLIRLAATLFSSHENINQLPN